MFVLLFIFFCIFLHSHQSAVVARCEPKYQRTFIIIAKVNIGISGPEEEMLKSNRLLLYLFIFLVLDITEFGIVLLCFLLLGTQYANCALKEFK